MEQMRFPYDRDAKLLADSLDSGLKGKLEIISIAAGFVLTIFFCGLSIVRVRYGEERKCLSNILTSINANDSNTRSLSREDKTIFARAIGYMGFFDEEHPIELIHVGRYRGDINKEPFLIIRNGPNISYEIPREVVVKYLSNLKGSRR